MFLYYTFTHRTLTHHQTRAISCSQPRFIVWSTKTKISSCRAHRALDPLCVSTQWAVRHQTDLHYTGTETLNCSEHMRNTPNQAHYSQTCCLAPGIFPNMSTANIGKSATNTPCRTRNTTPCVPPVYTAPVTPIHVTFSIHKFSKN